MDVDKPHQLELLRADLAKAQRKSIAQAKKAAPAKTAVKKTAAKTTSKAKPKKK
jgi:hypothetical protein